MKNKTHVSLSLRKLMLSVLVTAPLATLPVPLWALPADQAALNSQVVSATAGTTLTSTSATRVDVTTTAPNSVIKWSNFGGTGMTINNGDTISYQQPSATSGVLNMVTGSNPTQIDGTLTSNGSIYVLNPNGVTVGATGVITAAGVGLSTIPETEFGFQSNGTLTGTENNNQATTNPVVVTSGATITAASGSGNIWLAGMGANVAGTLDGNVIVKSVHGGTVALGSGGDLTVGDVATRTSTVAVTTDTGDISVANNVTVNGPTVSLTAGGNAAITQTGVLMIGAGSPGNATLTTSSGIGTQSFADAHVNGTGLLTINATGGAMTFHSSVGRLAVGATGGALVVTSAGDLTLNAGNVTSVDATSSNGNIWSGGTLIDSGAAKLTVSSGKDVQLHTSAAPGTPAVLALSSGTAFGNVTLTQDKGNISVPTLSAANLTVSAGNISFAGADTLTGTAAFTATGNIVIDQNVSGNVVTFSAGKDITQTTGAVNAATAAAGNVTLTATGGNITVSSSGIGLGTAPASVTLSAPAGNVAINGGITATAITATAGKELTSGGALNSTGTTGTVTLTSTSGNVTTTAAIGAGVAPKSVTINAAGNVSVVDISTQTGGSVTATATSGDVTQSTGTITTGTTGVVSLTSTNGNVTSATVTTGNATLSANKLLTIGNTVTVASGKIVATGGTDISQTGALSATGGNVTLTATAGNVSTASTIGAANVTINAGAKIFDGAAITTTTGATLTATGNIAIDGALTAPKLTISGAAITESSTITSSGNAILTSTDAITLAGANDFNNVAVVGAPNGASINDANSLNLADGTNTSGNLTITAAGNVNIGTSASGAVTVGKVLSITATAGNITDSTNNTNVAGNVSLTTTGTGIVKLDGASGTGVGLNNSYGQVSITTANQDATVWENTTLNLGAINLGTGNLNAYSATGIVNSGKLTVNNIVAGAGTVAAPGDIKLNFDSSSVHNAIAGTVTIQTDLGLLGSTTTIGNYLAGNIWVTNGVTNSALFSLPKNVYGNTAATNVTLTTVGATALVPGEIATTGVVSLNTATGAITATSGNNTFSNVSVTSGDTAGASNISSTKDLTVVGNITGTQAITFTAPNVIIGSFKSLASGGSAATTFAASSGSVTDSVSGISIYGPVTFTGKSVSITKSGHSFGAVAVDTNAANGNATIVESGYLNLGAINTGTGSFTGVSSNGDVGSSGTIAAGAVSLSAVNGAITSTGANAITGNVSLTAKNTSAFRNNQATALAATTVSSGGLTVTTDAGNISQASGTSIYTYGATTFASGAAINVTNSGNSFGNVTLKTTNANASIKEMTTLNLSSVVIGTGTLNATSEAGSIVDSGALTGTVGNFTASNGSILLTKNTDSFTNVSFVTGGNATYTDADAIAVDPSTVGGSLTVTASGAANNVVLNGATVGGDLTVNAGSSGSITQGLSTPLIISGNATFNAAGGALTLNNTSNQFGPVQFKVGSTSIIDEAGTFNLRAGTIATAPVTINTGGDFVTSGTGGSSFTGTPAPSLTINAPSGTIKPGTGSLLVTNGLAVFSNVAIDLNGLSLTGNLNGVTPTHTGTGTYAGPSNP